MGNVFERALKDYGAPDFGITGRMLFKDKQAKDPNPLLTEALQTIDNYNTIAPYQLESINEFGPQFAKAYGNTLAATYEGTLNSYENQISPALARVQTAQRGADLADVEKYGARSRQAILDSNPDTAALLKLLNADAKTGLEMGGRLNPNDTNRISRGVANDYSRRGFTSRMPASDLEQAMQMYSNSEAVRDSRRKQAGNVLGMNQAVVGDPFMQILGRSGQAIGAANNLFQQGQGQVSQAGAGNLYDPFKDAYSTMFHNQDMDLAKDNANKQMTGAIIGGALGAAGSIGGGFAKACWAAREVFGSEEVGSQRSEGGLKWIAFRTWLLTEAPSKLRNWYIANGERWAVRLKQNPAAKAVVRRWMERRIKL
jgi:hypothetical protein